VKTRNPQTASPPSQPQRVSITDSFGANPVSSAMDHSARRDPGGAKINLPRDLSREHLNRKHKLHLAKTH
jgi:hypothetical protein